MPGRELVGPTGRALTRANGRGAVEGCEEECCQGECGGVACGQAGQGTPAIVVPGTCAATLLAEPCNPPSPCRYRLTLRQRRRANLSATWAFLPPHQVPATYFGTLIGEDQCVLVKEYAYAAPGEMVCRDSLTLSETPPAGFADGIMVRTSGENTPQTPPTIAVRAGNSPFSRHQFFEQPFNPLTLQMGAAPFVTPRQFRLGATFLDAQSAVLLASMGNFTLGIVPVGLHFAIDWRQSAAGARGVYAYGAPLVQTLAGPPNDYRVTGGTMAISQDVATARTGPCVTGARVRVDLGGAFETAYHGPFPPFPAPLSVYQPQGWVEFEWSVEGVSCVRAGGGDCPGCGHRAAKY